MRAPFVLAAALLAAPLRAAPAPAYGIILLAHGGDASWNKEIETLRARVDAKIPAESALGMADPATLQAAVDRLEKRGVARIVAVPLFVQSNSEVLDQTRYALKLSDKPSEVLKNAYARMASAHAGHVAAAGAHSGHSMEFSTKRVEAREPVSMTAALDDHPLISRILTERAKALSRAPSVETVVLVAHGPSDDAALQAWETSLASLAAAVRNEGKFKSVVFAMLRDDASAEIRAAAVESFRAKVSAAKAGEGRAIVVPVLIARGGIEMKIAKDLDGLDYKWDGKTLMPHEGFDAWVLERAAASIDARN